jgi:replicative DNA helicase
LECPVIAVSQLSRKCEERTDKRPILSDLRDSGTIEQDADSVWMLYRQSYYDEDCANPDEAELFVRKSRQGQIGTVPLRFDGARMRFQSPSR